MGKKNKFAHKANNHRLRQEIKRNRSQQHRRPHLANVYGNFARAKDARQQGASIISAQHPNHERSIVRNTSYLPLSSNGKIEVTETKVNEFPTKLAASENDKASTFLSRKRALAAIDFVYPKQDDGLVRPYDFSEDIFGTQSASEIPNDHESDKPLLEDKASLPITSSPLTLESLEEILSRTKEPQHQIQLQEQTVTKQNKRSDNEVDQNGEDSELLKYPESDGRITGLSVEDAVRDKIGCRPRANSTDGELKLPQRGLCDERRVLEAYRWRIDESKSHTTPKGFVNLGNTCFLNSALQCLAYLPPFCQTLLSLPSGPKQNGIKQKLPQGKRITLIIQALFRQVHNNDTNSREGTIYPKSIVNAVPTLGTCGSRNGYKFRHGRQEDAHEFLVHLLDAMNDGELKEAGINQHASGWRDRLPISRLDETTFIHRIFGGYFRSQVQCNNCKYRSNTYDPFLDLSLEVSRQSCQTVADVINEFTRKETLDNLNRWKCSGCKKRVCASKHLTVFRPPLSLCIQLKRFTYAGIGLKWSGKKSGYFANFMGGREQGGRKISKPIAFPSHLKLPLSDGRSCDYSLTGVIIHVGGSASSGHYTAYVKKPMTKGTHGWYHMDDSFVEAVSEKSVLKQKDAYVLFYCRQEVKLEFPTPPLRSSMTAEEATEFGRARARARAESISESITPGLTTAPLETDCGHAAHPVACQPFSALASSAAPSSLTEQKRPDRNLNDIASSSSSELNSIKPDDLSNFIDPLPKVVVEKVKLSSCKSSLPSSKSNALVTQQVTVLSSDKGRDEVQRVSSRCQLQTAMNRNDVLFDNKKKCNHEVLAKVESSLCSQPIDTVGMKSDCKSTSHDASPASSNNRLLVYANDTSNSDVIAANNTSSSDVTDANIKLEKDKSEKQQNHVENNRGPNVNVSLLASSSDICALSDQIKRTNDIVGSASALQKDIKSARKRTTVKTVPDAALLPSLLPDFNAVATSSSSASSSSSTSSSSSSSSTSSSSSSPSSSSSCGSSQPRMLNPAENEDNLLSAKKGTKPKSSSDQTVQKAKLQQEVKVKSNRDQRTRIVLDRGDGREKVEVIVGPRDKSKAWKPQSKLECIGNEFGLLGNRHVKQWTENEDSDDECQAAPQILQDREKIITKIENDERKRKKKFFLDRWDSTLDQGKLKKVKNKQSDIPNVSANPLKNQFQLMQGRKQNEKGHRNHLQRVQVITKKKKKFNNK